MAKAVPMEATLSHAPRTTCPQVPLWGGGFHRDTKLAATSASHTNQKVQYIELCSMLLAKSHKRQVIEITANIFLIRIRLSTFDTLPCKIFQKLPN